MSTTKTPRRTSSRSGLSALKAAIKVLEEADGPMSAREVADQVVERKLAPGLKGKTPEATIAARLYVAAKQGKVRHSKRGFSAAKAG